MAAEFPFATDDVRGAIAYDLIKRVIDVLVAGTALILLSPGLLLIAAAVRWDSPGPVVFRQERIGRWGRRFMLYKFRTMVAGTPDLPSDTLAGEQRRACVTQVGGMLRFLALDEFPQLVNVLRGEMSLVGPRPALYNQDELIRMRRAQGVDRVRPGMTGLAQIQGRDSLSLEQKVAYDALYVRRRSLGLDALILLKTARAIIEGRGAN